MDCKVTRKLPSKSAEFQKAVCERLRYSLGCRGRLASSRQLFYAASLVVRELLNDRMLRTQERYENASAKRLYYLSMEYLMGRSLGNNLYNLGIFDAFAEGMIKMGVDLDELRSSEMDAGLGNGGLGRLAACFLDSLATMGIPGFGYGINYRYGLFRQEIDNGYQTEKLDHWQLNGSPWLIDRPEYACLIPIYGHIQHGHDLKGEYNPMWLDWKIIIGVPHDMPVVGYGGHSVNYLRLYSARSSDELDMEIFNRGDYMRAVEQKINSETISKILYPSDEVPAGQELRLVQEYFFVACALRDIIRNYVLTHSSMEMLANQAAIQLNDTHPSLAVAELMRILVDEHYLPWEKAWQITTRTISYTNHTLLSEALEKWPVDLLEHVLPRHLQIIYEINQRFLNEVRQKWPGESGRLSRMSLIEEGTVKKIRMAHLALVGSHSINGVAALHSELVKSTLLPDFYEMWPHKFNNKTNGITQRRWLLKANPPLAEMITTRIGSGWITDLKKLKDLEKFADDVAFLKAFRKMKLNNKKRLVAYIRETTRDDVDPNSLFSIQAKRIHEYKRQLLNMLHIIHRYFTIIEDGHVPPFKRTFIFAGKAAPGYQAAKRIIKLINNVAAVISRDKLASQFLKVVFISDYKVSLAEKIIPAADLSEQISTAGKEASGTGNMKFGLNGALTIGTLDGANIEIMEEVGRDNIFIFGLKAGEIQDLKKSGGYDPWQYYHDEAGIRRVMDSLRSDHFCSKEPGLFRPIFDRLLHLHDPYFHLADLGAYLSTQEKVEECYQDQKVWSRKAILNIARMGKFSSDRTISQYAEEIWGVGPVLD